MIATITTAVDAYVREDVPAKNYGNEALLSLSATAAHRRRSYIFFSTSRIPIGATIVSAVLYVYARGVWATETVITVRRITSKWIESGPGSVVWSNTPSVGGSSVTHTVAAGTASGTEIPITVTTLQQEAADGSPLYGYRIEIDTSDNKAVHSAEAMNRDLRPVLVVTWTTPPDAPTDLRPSGGRAVSVAKPVLSWQFVDDIRGESQSAFKVQIATTASEDDVEFDSGWVASVATQCPLEDTAYAGIDDGDTRFWRVNTKDNYGVAGEWSDWAEFSRADKGTVEITNPPDDPDNVVHDTSPPITHTFDGTQTHVQYALSKQLTSGAWKLIWRSALMSSDADTYTLLEGKIKDAATTYRIDVDVYDDVDREATPGDPIFVRASREFTYAPTTDVDPVETLTVSQGSGQYGAGIVLEWTRTEEPDFFGIKIDGVYYETRIPASDVIDEATPNYRYVYHGPGAGQPTDHTFEVDAVVLSGGVYFRSDDNPVEHFTPAPEGIWLVAPDDELYVRISRIDGVDLEIGESGEWQYPAGARVPVPLQDAIRGQEGAISGALVDDAVENLSAATMAAQMFAMKALPLDANIRLILVDANFKVTLGKLRLPPSPYSHYREITINVAQVADFDIDDPV